jgi:hypothetical protein
MAVGTRKVTASPVMGAVQVESLEVLGSSAGPGGISGAVAGVALRGAGGYSAGLSRSAQNVACDASGTPNSGELGPGGKATTTVQAWRGQQQLSAVASGPRANEFSIGSIALSGGTATWTQTANDTVRVDSLSTDSAVLRITLILEGSASLYIDYVLAKAKTGSSGANAISGNLTNDSCALPAAADGTVSNLSLATGTFRVFDGVTEKTGSAVTYSCVATNCTGMITTAGVYSALTFPAANDSAYLTLTAVYGGVTITKTFTLSKSKTGATGASGVVRVLTSLANVGNYDGEIALFNGLLYKWSVSGSSWGIVLAGTVGDPSGMTYTPSAPTCSFAVAKRSLSVLITPQANLLNADGWDVQISRDNATWYAPNLAADADADPWYTGSAGGTLKLNQPSLALGYLPITLDGNSLPVAAGQAYYLRVRARCSNPTAQSAWTASAALTVLPLLGADIAAAQVTNALIAANAIAMSNFAAGIRPPRVVSALPANPYTGYALGDLVSLTSDGKLYRMTNMSGAGTSGWTAAVATSDLSGTISDAQIAAMAASKLSGQITGTQITDSAVTTAKIAALAITAAKIAAGTITANELAANSVTTAKIAAGAIGADKIAALAITAANIAAGAITADKISVSQLAAIVANLGTITAGVLKSYDWVPGVSGFIIDLDAGSIKREDGSWSLSSSGDAVFYSSKVTGINFEAIDFGTYDGTAPAKTYDGGDYVVSGQLSLPDSVFEGGAWMGG